MTTIAFDLKYHTLSWRNPLAVEHKLDRVDKRIGKKAKKLEYDLDHVKNLRQENFANVQKLERALARVEGRDVDEKWSAALADSTIKNLRGYENSLRRQLKDTMRIIALLQKLVENEDYEIIFDIRQPMLVMEHFFKQLKEGLKRVKIENDSKKEFKHFLEEINKEFDNLVDKTLEFIHHDLTFFHDNYGLNFDKMRMAARSDTSISRHLKKRGVIKQQLNGKTQWITSQLNQLEGQLKTIRSGKRKVKDEDAAELLRILSLFKKEFSGLVQFALDRVDASSHMIVESVHLQKEHYAQLEDLKKELTTLYNDLTVKKAKMTTAATNDYHRNLHDAHYNEFLAKWSSLDDEVARFEKEFGRDLQDLLKKDTKGLRKEKRELKRIRRVLQGFRKKMTKLIIGIAMLSMPSSFAMDRAGESIIRPATVKEVLDRASVDKELQTDILKHLLSGDQESIQKRIDEINQKRKLTEEDVAFMKALYHLLARGGVPMGLPTASQFLVWYVDGVPQNAKRNAEGDVLVESRMYEKSPAVNEGMRLMVQKICELHKQGKLPDKGSVTSTNFITGESKDQDFQNEGVMRDGNIKVSNTQSANLFYSDRRFPLKADYSFDGDRLQVAWSVRSLYDFEGNTGKTTPLGIPGTDASLDIPHRIAKRMHQQGHAGEFWTIASWGGEYDVPAP